MDQKQGPYSKEYFQALDNIKVVNRSINRLFWVFGIGIALLVIGIIVVVIIHPHSR